MDEILAGVRVSRTTSSITPHPTVGNQKFYSHRTSRVVRPLTLETSNLITAIQGHIYVANEYPTFARTILFVCPKIRISRQNYF